ncbi:MAG: MMPL family transporter [Alphaproteobacteria bacterium]
MKNFITKLLNYPKSMIICFSVLSLISVLMAICFLKIETSTDSLINEELQFKKDQKQLKNNFKYLNNNILVRISGGEKKNIDRLSIELINFLKKRDDIYFVYSPSIDPIFKKNFFNFIDQNEKEKLISNLFEYQPFFSEINSNPRLKGFNNLLSLALKSDDSESIRKFIPLLSSFNQSLEFEKNVDWLDALNTSNPENYVLLGYKNDRLNDFGSFYLFLDKFKEKNLNHSIEFTGGLIIDFEEIKSVADGSSISGILSLIFVSILLWIAFRNIGIIFYLVLTVLVGLSITIGLTSITVGRLNLISVAFAVLFIGLSVDYGIQIFSRILETKKSEVKSLINEVVRISKTLLLASIPSMIGFLSFTITDYKGLSELGVISFIGLIVGLLTNLIFLPSLLVVFKLDLKQSMGIKVNYYEKIYSYFVKNKNPTFVIIIIISLFTFFSINKIKFDSDAMNLKDQSLNSVKLAKQLIEKNPTSDYIISIIVNKEELDDNNKLNNLLKKDSVKSYFSYLDLKKDYINQDLDYLKFLIETQKSEAFFSEPEEFSRLFQYLKILTKEKDEDLSSISQKLLNKLDGNQLSNSQMKEIEKIFFIGFNDLMSQIQNFGIKNEDFINQLPPYYVNRYLSETGQYRLEVFPSKDVTKKENLKEFVEDVTYFFPKASGMPVVQYKAGEIVVKSFLTAFALSVTFLLIFVYLIFRNLYSVVVSFLCLLIASVLSVFFMIAFKINFNFANMIALPLLYSLGISFPIYYIKRFFEFNGSIIEVIKSNTPKAVFFSGFTTMSSFSTLAISNHNGTSSMGILLFICLSMTIVSSLVFLPLILRFLKISIK